MCFNYGNLHDTTDQNIFQPNKITYAMSPTKNDS